MSCQDIKRCLDWFQRVCEKREASSTRTFLQKYCVEQSVRDAPSSRISGDRGLPCGRSKFNYWWELGKSDACPNRSVLVEGRCQPDPCVQAQAGRNIQGEPSHRDQEPQQRGDVRLSCAVPQSSWTPLLLPPTWRPDAMIA
eukprot:5127640-Amphidinium_carterae.3